jgi:mRNA-degrading endonuclease toxin of MazEF toxin-antitoxin module
MPDHSVKLPPETNRTEHPRRPVVVLSRDVNNADAEWPVFLGCPISSQGYATEFDVKVVAGAGGLARKGWVRVALAQPFSKTDAMERVGQFDANTMEQIVARLLNFIGAIE